VQALVVLAELVVALLHNLAWPPYLLDLAWVVPMPDSIVVD
jgi:hypothetical protein